MWAIPAGVAIVDHVARDEYLRVPFVMAVESVEKPGGNWPRRASYPELPGAIAEAESVIDAIDRADDKRIEIILDRPERGMAFPVPRPAI